MSSTATQLEVIATGISFEQIRVDYWKALNQTERADQAERELLKWQNKFDAARLNQGGEVKG